MLRNQKGFTLMELMVVIVIVAILAAVAVPLYINYVKDAQRTEAKGAIGAVITAQQTFFQINQGYGTTTFVLRPGPTDQRDTVDPSRGSLNCDLTEALVNWTIITTATGTGGADGYTVEATGKGPALGLYVKYTYSRADPTLIGWTETAP